MAIISNGELLLEGAPSEALDSLVGKIWSKVVATDDEFRALESTFNVISTHLIGGLHEIRVYADSSPGDGFRPGESGLEDVYFLNLASSSAMASLSASSLLRPSFITLDWRTHSISLAVHRPTPIRT
jgi:ABC-2 type transport system ATP-binding protein